jgi:hypothetical protein
VLFDAIAAIARQLDPAERVMGAEFVREALGLFGLAPLLDRPVEGDVQASFDDGFVERLRERLGDALHLNGVVSPEAAIETVIDARNAARKNKDFALSDRLRDALADEGITLKDSKDGTTWTAAAR